MAVFGKLANRADIAYFGVARRYESLVSIWDSKN
jgi:hypothetical protein